MTDRVVVVLVEPRHPGNVGAVARAMRNTGLERLVVVAPPAFDPMRARWMAPGCDELIAAMRIVGTLDEALEGVHRVVATTARHRKGRQPVLTPRQLAARVLDGADDEVTAILFGREDSGLDKAAVARCDALVRIPTPEHASLNLAQATLVVAYTLFEAAREHGAPARGRTVGGTRGSERTTRSLARGDHRDRRADVNELEEVVVDVVTLLERVGYTRATNPEKVALTTRGALQEAGLSVRQVAALRGMVSRIEWALDHPDVDWTALRKR